MFHRNINGQIKTLNLNFFKKIIYCYYLNLLKMFENFTFRNSLWYSACTNTETLNFWWSLSHLSKKLSDYYKLFRTFEHKFLTKMFFFYFWDKWRKLLIKNDLFGFKRMRKSNNGLSYLYNQQIFLLINAKIIYLIRGI